MRRFVAAPLAAARPIHQKARHAVRTRRLGALSADHGLDVLTFFLADVQTGFGPFIAVYLATSGWSAAAIGSALGIGQIVTIVAQVPAGAAIDVIAAKRGATLVALLAVLGSALLLALFPRWWPIVGAEVLHGFASCMLLPAVAAVTLSRVGRAALAHRLGRNTRFMALGNGIGAGLMGLAGRWLAAAPFWLAAASTIPAILALLALPPRHETEPRPQRLPARHASAEGWRVLRDRRLLAFVVCVVLFQAANAFIVPLAVDRLTAREGGGSTDLVLAAGLVVSQGVVAALSPWVGRTAERLGRRPVLLLGFAAVPLHAAALALIGGPAAVIGTQVLDGIGGAVFGVMEPLVAADITRGTNRFNLSLGVLGLAVGLGGSASYLAGGRIAARFGFEGAFVALAALGVLAVAAVWLLMPETRHETKRAGGSREPGDGATRGAHTSA